MSSPRHCPGCGNPVDPDAQFCSNCGTPVPQEPAGPRYCHSCGSEVLAGASFCQSCGANLQRSNGERKSQSPSRQRSTPASQHSATPRRFFSGWRKAAIITLVALVLLCPPTGLALYLYDAQQDDNNASIINPDVIGEMIFSLDPDDFLIARAQFESGPDVPVSSLEISGENSWTFLHIEASSGTDSMDVALDARGLPTAVRLPDKSNLTLEYFPDDIVVQYLLDDGHFGAYVIPIEGELRDLIDQATGQQSHIEPHDATGRLAAALEPAGAMTSAGALIGSVPRIRLLDESASDSDDLVPIDGSAYVSVSAYADDGFTTPISGVNVEVRCDGEPCQPGAFWEPDQSTRRNIAINAARSRGIQMSDAWINFGESNGSISRVRYETSLSRSQAAGDYPVSIEDERALIRDCEEQRRLDASTFSNGSLGINTLWLVAGLLAGLATSNPGIGVAVALLGYLHGTVWPWIEARAEEPLCVDIVRQAIEASQLALELSERSSTIEVCISHPHYTFSVPCQTSATIYPFGANGPASRSLGPSQPINLVFVGKHIDYNCDEHISTIVLDRREGSQSPQIATHTSAVHVAQRGQFAVEDDIVLKYSPLDYLGSCDLQPAAEASPTPLATPTPLPPTPEPLTWVLAETRINPANAPLEDTSKEDYNASYTGSIDAWVVTETSITAQKRTIYLNEALTDATSTFNFDAPPRELVPGETFELNASGTMSVSAAIQPPFEQFQYSLNGNQVAGSYFTVKPDVLSDSSSIQLTTPSGSPGDEFTIAALLWNCPACHVVWVYRATEGG